MPDQIETFADVKMLQAKLADILTSGALYRTFAYKGYDCHTTGWSGSTQVRYGTLPSHVNMFCDSSNCGHKTWWRVNDADVYFGRESVYQRRYTCNNCGNNTVHYCFRWQELKDKNVFFKVGQYPELEERIDESLRQSFDSSDLKLYKNALRMRNFNLGLAAAAYMRRVVENRMNDMLDILHETAVTHNMPGELLKRQEEVKAEKRFTVKVQYAGDLLPPYLRPAGKPNPLQILHELTSDGLHARSDEECVDVFDACRRTFEFVFGKLRIEAEQARAFVKDVATLAVKKQANLAKTTVTPDEK